LRFTFLWDNTPEGHEIWFDVYNGNYAPFRAFHANLKQPESNGWISVEERLPEINNDDEWDKEHKISKKCLVYENEEHNFGVYYYESENWVVNARLGNINVTHWQPLPPPPAKH
jgi:hypothetical protein